MKSEIIEYLKERQQASVDELAAALGKGSSKDFSSMVKTISQMERKHQIRFDDKGRIELYEKKKQERLTLKGVFHAHKNGFGFVTLNEEEDDLFVGASGTRSASCKTFSGNSETMSIDSSTSSTSMPGSLT